MKKSPSRVIDQAIFKAIDQLKSSHQFIQISTFLDSLPENYGKYINQTIAYTFSFFPLFLLGILVLYLSLSYNSISDKEDLLDALSELNEISHKVNSYEQTILNNTSISDLSMMKKKIDSLKKRYNISKTSLNVTSFKSERVEGITKAIAQIKIQSINFPSLLSFLKDLSVNQNFQISNINLSRTSKSMIKGTLSIFHLGKN